MSSYLERAQWAIDYVSNTVRMKTGNRFEGINRLGKHKKSTDEIVAKSRDFACAEYKRRCMKSTLEEINLRAQVAQHCQCGNCTEQSAFAFDYLRSRGERGMAWICFPSHNHMFTVLGLDVPPAETEEFKIGSGPPASWGPKAVVCDPWYHEWFSVATDWDRKIIYILRDAAESWLRRGTKVLVACRGYV